MRHFFTDRKHNTHPGLHVFRSPNLFHGTPRFFFSSDTSTRKCKVHCCISAARLNMASQTDTVSHLVQAACFLHMSHYISFRHWKTLHTLAKLTSQTIVLAQNWSLRAHTFTARLQRRITQWKLGCLSNLRVQWVNYRLQGTYSILSSRDTEHAISYCSRE